MAESKYEKYVVRQPMPPDPTVNWGRPDLGILTPYFFTRPGGALKDADILFECVWIAEDCAFGVTEDRGPHKHDCDEIFAFLGTNPKDTEDLGCEVEFWMGEGEETEQIKINTSSIVHVPGGLLHLPLFFRNVKRPIIHLVIGLNIGETLQSTVRVPVRGV